MAKDKESHGCSTTWFGNPGTTPGVESLRLDRDSNGINASSHLLQSLKGRSIAATYVLNCDPALALSPPVAEGR